MKRPTSRFSHEAMLWPFLLIGVNCWRAFHENFGSKFRAFFSPILSLSISCLHASFCFGNLTDRWTDYCPPLPSTNNLFEFFKSFAGRLGVVTRNGQWEEQLKTHFCAFKYGLNMTCLKADESEKENGTKEALFIQLSTFKKYPSLGRRAETIIFFWGKNWAL